ncbi:MAG: alpha amylase C-terminal domain-containing protein [Bacteroidaceae bacterium]|nr:alpha amylase C-terminal domain-containing protein [Bacteroidaceae bacterium]MBO7247092.1 alpha amylase C-terminal domain-containing protein [Bacteroidaceae bacterium]
MRIVDKDPWLKPYEKTIKERHNSAVVKESQLIGDGTLSDFALGYMYYGLHFIDNEWIFREWAPNATAIYLIGDFNEWRIDERYRASLINRHGDWQLRLPKSSLRHGQHYKMLVRWKDGEGERIPAWCRRVVQDPVTGIFSAQVWKPETEYRFANTDFKIAKDKPLLIYECHIGMAQEKEDVGTYIEFKDKVLPRIKEGGYNCIQIMAVQEHPYYGSFGYHVSNFFAPSSRFGTPEELKELIDTAHSMGIAVIMDIVHSHAVANENEGLGNLSGDKSQYFHSGERREHSAWGSLCFDYGKDQVLHFLLSNCKYWLEEYHFDGFRFDGVTSMIYYSHGLGESFGSYQDYFNDRQDGDAICYLMLANKLIHECNPNAITIAEEVSGMPGLAAPFANGGYGFNYRMAMNIPDYWIKIIKELSDDNWSMSGIYWEITNRRSDEKTISYVESHDQALVGDKTVIFRLVDSDMYWHFSKSDGNLVTARGIALHKMIRLITATTINGGYLNFMGNEFGHPEWIDFPREGNGWSYKYARRQWSLVDNQELCYSWLNNFDKKLINLLGKSRGFQNKKLEQYCLNDSDKVVVYGRGEYLFVYNFNPVRSFTDYGVLVPHGEYKILLNSDNNEFGGNELVDENQIYQTISDTVYGAEDKGWLKMYLPARTALILKRKR